MASSIAISVKNLSKSYLIGHQAMGPETFREMLSRRVYNSLRGLINVSKGEQLLSGDEVEEFWALRDVTFDVRRGEVLGVIGRNGAGKSTLLKLLSRITEPTNGRVVIRGRVSSLLEVGTGFHPDLTGRENIFLNGAILGLSRAEIKSRFDEIVAFAEVARFLDTPVKRYSSGMYVRLAFAVAAHLEPEILIVDEVLAVGDAEFQRKCLGKMQGVANSGRTVLFVSHNLPAVMDLTQRCILLDKGQVSAIGPSGEIVSKFLREIQNRGKHGCDVSPYRRTNRAEGTVDIENVKVCGHPFGAASIEFGKAFAIDVALRVKRTIEGGTLTIVIIDEQFQPVVSLASADVGHNFTLYPGLHTHRCRIEALPLVPGAYYVTVGIQQGDGVLAWDVVEILPGFRIDRNDQCMKWPNRPGVLLHLGCAWGAVSEDDNAV